MDIKSTDHKIANHSYFARTAPRCLKYLVSFLLINRVLFFVINGGRCFEKTKQVQSKFENSPNQSDGFKSPYLWNNVQRTDQNSIQTYKRWGTAIVIQNIMENQESDLSIARLNLQNSDRKIDAKEISLFEMFRFADSDAKIMMVLASFFAFSAGGLIPVYCMYVGKANQFLTELTSVSEIEATINSTGTMFIYFGLGIFISMAISLILFFFAGEKQETAIRKAYLRALMRQEATWYDFVSPAQLASTFSSDVQHIRLAISNHLAVLLQIVGCCIVSLILIFITGWLLSLVCLLILPLIVLVSYMYLKSYEGRNKQYKKIYSKAGTLSEQAIYAIKTVKMLNGEPAQESKYCHQLGMLKQHYYRLSSRVGVSVALMNISFFLLNTIAYWYGSECVVSGSICPQSFSKQVYEPVTVSIIFFVLLSCYYLVVLISPTTNGLSLGKNAAAKVFAIIDRQPRIASPENAVRPEHLRGLVEFEHVSFAFPKNPERKVLNNINIRFDVQSVALMGESGCGKSTILQLMLRLYDPDEGRILIDGHDLRDLDLEWLREQIGYVGQEPVLFAGSIRDNLKFYASNATDQDIQAAIKNAQIYDFVYKELKKGLDTYVGVGGKMISGGQKQRLAIARALLKKPKVLILDQATSALDKRNEQKILQNLRKLPYEVRTISVSHRVQVSQMADYVYVFDEGEIAEQGKFRQLNLYQCFTGIVPTTRQLQQLYLRKTMSKKISLMETIHLVKKQTSKLRQSLMMSNANCRSSQSISSGQLKSRKKLSKAERSNEENKSLVKIDSAVIEEEEEDQNQDEFLRQTEYHCILNAISEAPKQIKKKKNSRRRRQKITHIEEDFFQFMENLPDAVPEEKLGTMALLGKVFDYNKDRKCIFVLAIILSFVLGMTIPTMSYISAQLYFSLALINNYSLIGIEPLAQSQTDEGFQKRKVVVIMFFCVGALYFLVYLFQVICSYMVGSEVTRNLRERLYAKFLKMPISWFQRIENNPGMLSSALGQDCETINNLASMLVFVVIIIVIGISSCYIVGFFFNWKITLLGLAFLPFILFCALYKSHLQAELDRSKEEVRRDSNIIVAETLIDIKTVTALNVSNQLHARYCELEDRPQEEARRTGIKMGLVTALGHLTNYAALGALFYFTGKLFTASNFTLDLESAIIALFEAANVTFAISSNYHFIPNVSESFETVERVFKYFNQDDEEMIMEKQKSKKLNEGITDGEIEFKNVDFSYNNRQTKLFEKLNFTLKKGTSLALVGKSGCGKSTVMNLVMRFYETTGGQITIDGINIKDFDIHYLRSKMGIVSQEPVLINGSIRDNILYGRPTATQEEMQLAAEKSNAMKFIMREEDIESQNSLHIDAEGEETIEESLSSSSKDSDESSKKERKGFEKLVGFNGSNLSGGQKQRIAIARIVVKNPTILLFDEATSALDVQNESKMQNLLDGLAKGKSTLTISHKLQSVKSSDLILMIDNGRIVEHGSFNELLKKKGYFFNLQNGQDAQIIKKDM